MPNTAPPAPGSTTADSPQKPLRPAVVDLAADTNPQKALHQALSAHGFVAVRNAGVGADLKASAFASARSYFAQSTAIKLQTVYNDTNANFGYQGMRSEALDPNQPADEADLKEAFTMRSLSNRSQPTESKDKTNLDSVWDDSEFGRIATALHQRCSEVSQHLLSLIAKALGSDPDTFAPHHTGENMTLRYLHYPAPEHPTPSDDAKRGANEKKMPQLGAGAHTDYGTITLLFSDGVAGLQLYDKSASAPGENTGRWRDVEVAPGDVLVNTGDLMSLWSNGCYPSTLHRVQPRLSKPDRYSVAFFVDPDSSTRVSPLPSCIDKADDQDAHPTSTHVVVAGEHIQARIEASQRTLA